MKSETNVSTEPNWDKLYEFATSQGGLFTTSQAAEAGYYPQLLTKYLKNGRIIRVRRGVYRLVHFPTGEHEDLIAIWLWADKAGVYSHETALMLHRLSDALPAKAHLTLPGSWKKRRLRVPKGLTLYFSDIDSSRRAWIGPVPVTNVEQTIIDCANDSVPPEFVHDAFEQALARGLVDPKAMSNVIAYLDRFFAVQE